MSQQSSIALSKKTKEQLNELKNFPSETFEEVIRRIITAYANDDDLLTDDDLVQIEKSLKQIRDGKYKTLKQIKEKYRK